MEEKSNNEIGAWLKIFIIGFLCLVGIRYFLLTPIVVDGASMNPTFNDGDRVVVNKISSTITGYERFDIIVFKFTGNTHYIKRIIGVPGDHIEYKNDELYINDKKYEEPYLDEFKFSLKDNEPFTENFTLEAKLGEVVVPEGHYFILGDNRRNSVDSRVDKVGFVSSDQIIGTASFIFWPLGTRE
ncbi:signal peptidase I [Lysinibacillus sp. NPDC048646]|uniref:signal peptidase I n=1 Tax=Lysinibacillus sp. NPDC048646 TaxID=3390574 RepID=UPI003D05B63B